MGDEAIIARKRKYLRKWKLANPDKYRAGWKQYNAKHSDKINAGNKERYAQRKDKYRWRRDLNRSIIIAVKNVPCIDCSTKFPWYVMDLDHVRGIKKCNISRMASTFTTEKILDEIAKCDVVCSNCHRERTFQRGGYNSNE